MNILFLCTSNVNRSKTAENLFRSLHPEHNFLSAGLSEKYCKANNSTLCTVKLLQWADRIYVFEQIHIDRIIEHTGTRYLSRITNLDIEDVYAYMEDRLCVHLKSKLESRLISKG